MRPENIARRWGGAYKHDLSPANAIQFPSVNFELHIEIDESGKFSGWIVEGTSGIPERATVQGQVSGNQIRFTKFYRHFWVADESGIPVAIAGMKPLEVLYKGVLDSKSAEMHGTWRIEELQSHEIDGVEYEFPETTGTWYLRPTQIATIDISSQI